jgi:Clr5 domain
MAGVSPSCATTLLEPLAQFCERLARLQGCVVMVYSWDDKEAECYRLYVEEKKSLDEVISYWEARGFTPRYL